MHKVMLFAQWFCCFFVTFGTMFFIDSFWCNLMLFIIIFLLVPCGGLFHQWHAALNP